MQKSEELVRVHQYEKARVEIKNALQIDPKDSKAHVVAGQVAEKLQNVREAFGHYQSAFELDEHNNAARVALARLYVFAGAPDKAIELVQAGLDATPNDAGLLVIRGAARAQQNQLDAAMRDAQQAASVSPDDEYSIALLASLYRRSGQADRAADVVAKGLEHSPQSIDLHVMLAELRISQNRPADAQGELKKIIQIEPEVLGHRYQLARLYAMQKDAPAAEQVLKDAAASAPDNAEPKLALVEFIGRERGAAAAQKQVEQYLHAAPDEALQLSLAGYLERTGQADRARQLYLALVDRAGVKANGLAARNHLASMALRTGDVAQAAKLVAEVLKENPRDNDALIMRGNIELARGEALAAITDLRAVLRDQPNSAPVMRTLARAHMQNREPAMAEEVLRSSSQANPADPQSKLDLAQFLSQQGRPDQAQPLFQSIVDSKGAPAEAFENLFRLQVAAKDYSSAKTTVEKLQAAFPDTAAGFYLAGLINEAQEQRSAAVENYQRALQVQGQAMEPLAALVRLDVQARQPDKAIERIDRVLEKYPDQFAAWNLKGELLLGQHSYEAAQRAFQSAIDRQPQWWVAYRGLAASLLAQNKGGEALQTLQHGVTQSHNAMGLVTDLASIQERTGHPDAAITLYEDVIKTDPDSVIVANNLAMLLVTYRQDKASLERARGLTDKLSKTEEPAILNTRGWVHYKAGEFREALPLLQQAVEKSPASAVMHYHLAMAQLKSGDRQAAKRNLETALQGGQGFAGDGEARATLDEIKRAG